MSIFQEVIARKIPYTTWYSDLRIPVTTEIRELVKNSDFSSSAKIFYDTVTGKPWFDLPHQNEKFWEDKLKLERN